MANTTTMDGATFLTVPASTLWSGHIMLSGTLASGAGASSAQSAAPSVTVSGSGGNFSNGDTVVKLQLNTPTQLVGALSGTTSHGDISIGPINVQARATGPISLILNTGGSTAACATAIGEM